MLRINRILVPCDFSEFSDAAASRACELAQKFDATLHLLNVVAPPPVLSRAEPEADRLRQARQRLDQQLPPHAVVELAVERASVAGTPHREICRYAQQHDIDLIVMGTHGRTGLAHATIGSVAEKVLRSAPCQVLIIRRPEQEEDLARQAVKLLRDEFGTSLAGEFGETRATLRGRLMRILNISDQAAGFALESLQSDQTLIWADAGHGDASQPRLGAWQIAPSDSAAEPFISAAAGKDDMSPALDLITRALTRRATDIHIDPTGREHLVRFRIDGRLERYCGLDPDVAGHLIQQYKTLARLDIADPFHPQEGRLRLPPSFADQEVRITISPVACGDAVALRLFDRSSVFRPLDRLGLSEQSVAAIDQMLRRGEGLVLVTGPTGSGKTTTVYSMLESLGSGERNIVSIEDPVEFPAPFVRQIEVDEPHGLTMTSGLRVLLRMDPDVVFLGEIRDTEAADIAMRAASSGKYVFSTFHTRDVASTVTALRDLHVDSRSLSGNLTGIISQRIIRRLCLQCRRAVPLASEAKDLLHRYGLEPPAQLFEAARCANCRGTGYRGRVGVFEVVPSNEEISRQIARGKVEHELRELIRGGGTPDLMADALMKVCAGITSLDEAERMRSV